MVELFHLWRERSGDKQEVIGTRLEPTSLVSSRADVATLSTQLSSHRSFMAMRPDCIPNEEKICSAQSKSKARVIEVRRFIRVGKSLLLTSTNCASRGKTLNGIYLPLPKDSGHQLPFV